MSFPMNVSYIDINEIIREIKEKHRLRPLEEVEEIIMSNIESGFRFQGQLIKAVAEEFYNPFENKKKYWFHFLCPKCNQRAKKLFILYDKIAVCRKCSKIRHKAKVNTQADRALVIQKYINEIFQNRKMSAKQKKRKMEYIVVHYDQLDAKYKMLYNTFVFKHLQSWCVDTLKNKEKSDEYKNAIKDILSVIKDSKKILSKTALINSGNKN